MDAAIDAFKEVALLCGFSHVGALDPAGIELRTEVRDACAENKCGSYATNWACPPGCGTLEDCKRMIDGYKNGLIVQTTGQLRDSFDGETMQRTSEIHAESFQKFCEAVRAICPEALLLNTGPCKHCAKCAYPETPCLFPRRMTSSMEAFGMLVSDVCKANDIPYYYGPNTLTYVACVLF